MIAMFNFYNYNSLLEYKCEEPSEYILFSQNQPQSQPQPQPQPQSQPPERKIKLSKRQMVEIRGWAKAAKNPSVPHPLTGIHENTLVKQKQQQVEDINKKVDEAEEKQKKRENKAWGNVIPALAVSAGLLWLANRIVRRRRIL